MGKLIKNHLARLLTLVAATYMFAASVHAFFWPKLFYDFATLNLNVLVKPVPYLQIVEVVLALLILAFEWPLSIITKWPAVQKVHASIELRLTIYPGAALLIALLYQGSDPALYFLIASGLWFWAYIDGEVGQHWPAAMLMPHSNSHHIVRLR